MMAGSRSASLSLVRAAFGVLTFSPVSPLQQVRVRAIATSGFFSEAATEATDRADKSPVVTALAAPTHKLKQLYPPGFNTLKTRDAAFQAIARRFEREYKNQVSKSVKVLKERANWTVVYGSGHAGIGIIYICR